MIAWALVNTLLIQHILDHKAFDPYPYILLNLFLSMLAGIQGATLLIAAKRADAISSEVALHTANNTDDIKTLIAENTALTERMKKNTTSSKRFICTSPTSRRNSAPKRVTSRPARNLRPEPASKPSLSFGTTKLRRPLCTMALRSMTSASGVFPRRSHEPFNNSGHQR